jgi:DNA-binding transcriptional ArsR family regulator
MTTKARRGAAGAAAPARGEDRVLTDPRAIRALAHPARLTVLDLLAGGRQLTATACAEAAELSPSAMSYHLRALEKWGFVERAESSGDGRERPWQAVPGSWRIESIRPEVGPAVNAIVGISLDRAGADTRRWFAHEREAPPAWRDAAGVDTTVLWMTAEEATELGERYRELLDRHRDRTAQTRPPDARRVRTVRVLVPVDDR